MRSRKEVSERIIKLAESAKGEDNIFDALIILAEIKALRQILWFFGDEDDE